jgi:hypothetical protein
MLNVIPKLGIARKLFAADFAAMREQLIETVNREVA